MSDFLFEIGLEEIPARMIASAQAELLRRTLALLERERLLGPGTEAPASYSTPRRLAVLIPGVKDRQEDLTEDVLGPAAKIAYKDGVPTPAAHAFARKAGVAVEELRTVATPKGDYLAATSVKAGRTAAEILTSDLPKEIAGIYWAKNMYWRAGKPERFVRPVRWLLALLGGVIVPVEFGGVAASNLTYGHRILHGDAPIAVESATAYVGQLTQAHVMADVELRRHTIRKALDKVCRTLPDARWREDHALVDKMTHLTEWPAVIGGGFDAGYLTLPEEVLVTVMRDHQNYFAVATGDGKLAPHFLAVLNTVASPEGDAVIRHGNARVLRARFNDARFFWEFDQRILLEDRAALLDKVTFQKDLGSYAAKAVRVAAVAQDLTRCAAERGAVVNEEALWTAVRLAKTDLTTELVKEFTELQGQIGGLYAAAQGVPQAACDAIYDQYRPASMEDRIPRTIEGQLLAIADKADTIAGMFGLGMEPTGSKDPFALRRAANGIVKIVAESGLALRISDVIAASGASEATAAKMTAFYRERLEFYLREVNASAYDVINAVLAVGSDDVGDAIARANAVTAVRSGEDFLAVSAAFKRMANILAQAREKGIVVDANVDANLLLHEAERQLVEKTTALKTSVAALRERKDYRAALEQIATIRTEVDAFFDGVMVMDPDARIQANRLATIAWVLEALGGIASFSEIVVAG